MAVSFLPYIAAVRGAFLRLLLVSVAVGVLAYAVVHRLGPTYEVHFSYLVSLSERETVPEYQFDGYYALQATDLFAATLARWATTSEVIVAAYSAAGIDSPTDDPRALGRSVAAVKSAPQLVEVTVRGKQRDEVERLAVGLRRVMEQNVARYHDEGIPALHFRVVATEPWVGTTRLSASVIVSAVFIFTFLFGVNGVLLLESLRRVGDEDV